jgi:hypothetical protein
VVMVTLIDRMLNDRLQQKTRRHRWLSSFYFLNPVGKTDFNGINNRF